MRKWEASSGRFIIQFDHMLMTSILIIDRSDVKDQQKGLLL